MWTFNQSSQTDVIDQKMSMWKRRETSDHPSLGAWRGTSNFLHDSKSLMWRWFDEHGPRVSSIRWFKWLMGYIVLWHGRSYLSWEWSSCISDYSSSFLNAAWYLSAGFALTLIFFPFFFFFNLFLAALGLHCFCMAFSSCGSLGLLFAALRGILIAVASLVAEHRL